jgi:hypothetical protein
MTKDEVLKIHTDRFLGALIGQNYAALVSVVLGRLHPRAPGWFASE